MKWWHWAVGGLVVAGGALMLSSNVQAAAFALALPKHGRPYAAALLSAAKKHGLNPFHFAALIERESGYGIYLEPKGPGGLGDGGHGHGLSQVDDRTWGKWLAQANWKDPAVNLDKGAEILAGELRRFGGDYGKALAAYNAGPTNVARAVARGDAPDSVTTGKDYGTDILARSERIRGRIAS